MSILHSIKDHLLIGGPNAISGWGAFVLLVISGGMYAGALVPGLGLALFLAVVIAAACTGSGVYALNACYDIEADKVNKPNRPLPSGRMTQEHALKYAYGLMVSGLGIAAVVSIWQGNYLMIVFWSVFTLLGIAYSTPPLKLKARHFWGNLCFGAFAVLSFYIGVIFFPAGASTFLLVRTWISMLLYCVWVGGVIIMKDLTDVEGDGKNGDITLPVKVGRGKAAVIAIGIIAFTIMIANMLTPPAIPYAGLLDFIWGNWDNFVYIGSYSIYIGLNYMSKDHLISNVFSKVFYFFLILSVAYGLLKGPLGLTPVLLTLIPTVPNWDRFVVLAIYATVATLAILRSRSKGQGTINLT